MSKIQSRKSEGGSQCIAGGSGQSAGMVAVHRWRARRRGSSASLEGRSPNAREPGCRRTIKKDCLCTAPPFRLGAWGRVQGWKNVKFRLTQQSLSVCSGSAQGFPPRRGGGVNKVLSFRAWAPPKVRPSPSGDRPPLIFSEGPLRWVRKFY
jgi:hypothetical protein